VISLLWGRPVFTIKGECARVISSEEREVISIDACGIARAPAVSRIDPHASTPGVLLSYAGADRAVAARIVEGLRGAGANVWWDRDGIGWGDNWIETLQNTLTECTAYVILIGASGVRRWVKAERHIATRRRFENDLPVFRGRRVRMRA
jgi:hypothetical protein